MTASTHDPDSNDLAAQISRIESVEAPDPQTVVVTGGVGLAGLYFVGMLADVYDQPIFQAALATFVCSLVGSGVIAWFHGEKGPQKVTALEVVILAILLTVWIAILLAIFLL